MTDGDLDLVVLHHAANSRSASPLMLLEALGAPYQLKRLDITTGEQLGAAYRRVNPMGKVPAIEHRGQVVTELAAIFIYLADAFPKAGLAPPLDDPLRGPYLRWSVFYNASFEPAIVDKAMGREPGKRAASPYGDFESVMNALTGQLSRGPFLLGERLYALDILWGVAVDAMMAWEFLPREAVFEAYAARITALDCVTKARALDAAP